MGLVGVSSDEHFWLWLDDMVDLASILILEQKIGCIFGYQSLETGSILLWGAAFTTTCLSILFTDLPTYLPRFLLCPLQPLPTYLPISLLKIPFLMYVFSTTTFYSPFSLSM